MVLAAPSLRLRVLEQTTRTVDALAARPPILSWLGGF